MKESSEVVLQYEAHGVIDWRRCPSVLRNRLTVTSARELAPLTDWWPHPQPRLGSALWRRPRPFLNECGWLRGGNQIWLQTQGWTCWCVDASMSFESDELMSSQSAYNLDSLTAWRWFELFRSVTFPSRLFVICRLRHNCGAELAVVDSRLLFMDQEKWRTSVKLVSLQSTLSRYIRPANHRRVWSPFFFSF